MEMAEELSGEDLERMAEDALHATGMQYDDATRREVRRAIARGLKAVDRGRVSPDEALDIFRRMVDAARSLEREPYESGMDVIQRMKAEGELCPNIYCNDKD